MPIRKIELIHTLSGVPLKIWCESKQKHAQGTHSHAAHAFRPLPRWHLPQLLFEKSGTLLSRGFSQNLREGAFEGILTMGMIMVVRLCHSDQKLGFEQQEEGESWGRYRVDSREYGQKLQLTCGSSSLKPPWEYVLASLSVKMCRPHWNSRNRKPDMNYWDSRSEKLGDYYTHEKEFSTCSGLICCLYWMRGSSWKIPDITRILQNNEKPGLRRSKVTC